MLNDRFIEIPYVLSLLDKPKVTLFFIPTIKPQITSILIHQDYPSRQIDTCLSLTWDRSHRIKVLASLITAHLGFSRYVSHNPGIGSDVGGANKFRENVGSWSWTPLMSSIDVWCRMFIWNYWNAAVRYRELSFAGMYFVAAKDLVTWQQNTRLSIRENRAEVGRRCIDWEGSREHHRSSKTSVRDLQKFGLMKIDRVVCRSVSQSISVPFWNKRPIGCQRISSNSLADLSLKIKKHHRYPIE